MISPNCLIFSCEENDVDQTESDFVQEKRAVSRWKHFLNSQILLKRAMIKAFKELKIKEIMKRCRGTDMLDSFRVWRIFTHVNKRRKRIMFVAYRRHFMLRRLVSLCTLSLLREGFLKLRRRCRWTAAVAHAHRSPCSSVLSRLKGRARRRLLFLKSIHCAQKHVTRRCLNSSLRTLRSDAAAARRRKAVASTLHTRCAQRRSSDCSAALQVLHLHKARAASAKTVFLIATLFASRRNLFFSMEDWVTQWRGRRDRGLLLRHKLRATASNGATSGPRFCWHFSSDPSFFAFGKALHVNSKQRMALLLGCLPQLSRAINEWSCSFIVFLRYVVLWRRRVLVRINRRIRLSRAQEGLVRQHWQRWRVAHTQNHHCTRTCQIRASHHWKLSRWRVHWKQWICFRKQHKHFQSLHHRGRCLWQYVLFRAALQRWKSFAQKCAEQNNISSFIQKRKAMLSFFRFMRLRRFRLLAARAEVRWRYGRLMKSFGTLRRKAYLRCSVRRFVAVRSRYKHLAGSVEPEGTGGSGGEVLMNCWIAWRDFVSPQLNSCSEGLETETEVDDVNSGGMTERGDVSRQFMLTVDPVVDVDERHGVDYFHLDASDSSRCHSDVPNLCELAAESSYLPQAHCCVEERVVVAGTDIVSHSPSPAPSPTGSAHIEASLLWLADHESDLSLSVSFDEGCALSGECLSRYEDDTRRRGNESERGSTLTERVSERRSALHPEPLLSPTSSERPVPAPPQGVHGELKSVESFSLGAPELGGDHRSCVLPVLSRYLDGHRSYLQRYVHRNSAMMKSAMVAEEIE